MKANNLVLLGAAEYNSKTLLSSSGFKAAKEQLQEYFCDPSGFAIQDDNVLDLFDSNLSQIEQLSAIKVFLSNKSADLDELSGVGLTFLCYVGHGFLDKSKRGLFMATRAGGGVNKFAEAINSEYLLETVKTVGSDRKIIGIFDCCFAAAAMPGAMSDNQIEQAFEETAEQLPATGGMVIGSSGANERSYLLDDHSSTVFTQCFHDVLVGDKHRLDRPYLSGHMLREQILTAAHRRLGEFAPTPHIYDIDQKDFSLSTQEIFPIIPVLLKSATDPGSDIDYGSMKSMRTVTPQEELEIHKFVNGAREHLDAISNCVVQSGLQNSAYLNKVRLKDIDRIVEKIVDRRTSEEDPNPSYALENVTDVIGIRFIALYRNEMDRLIEDVMRLLTGSSKVSPNPMRAKRICEAKVYSTKPTEAGENQILKGLIEAEFADARKHEAGLQKELDVEIIGRKDYSSVHLVAELDLSSCGRAVFVEIQVRSILEDVWATIDHDLRYSRDRSKNGYGRDEGVESNPYLQNLKSFFDAASDYADLIKVEIDTRTKSKPNSMQPIDGSYEFQVSARELGLDSELERLIVELLIEKEEIDKRRQDSRRAGPQKRSDALLGSLYNGYKDLADKFKILGDQSIRQGGLIGPDFEKDEPALFALYSIRMEEAYCRACVFNSQRQMQSAQRIYEYLGDLVSDSPVVLLRLAESYAKNGRWDEAIEAYSNARTMFFESLTESTEKRNWRLTDKQLYYFKSNLPRLMGFAYWSKTLDAEASKEEKVENLVTALSITNEGLQEISDSADRIRYINNIVYYYSELKELDPENETLGVVWFDAIKDQFRDLVAAADGSGLHAFQIKDTIVKYGRFFGFQEDAKRLAGDLFQLCMEPHAEAVYGKTIRERALLSVLQNQSGNY